MRYLFCSPRYFVVALFLGFGFGFGCSEVVSPMEGSLASLTIGPSGSLEPEFSSTIDSYTATVAAEANEVTLTTVPGDNATTVAINGVTVTPGQPQSVALRPAGTPTPIEIVTTSSNGHGSKYTIMVSRLAAGEAKLAALSVTPGKLEPNFSPDNNLYQVHVDHPVETVTISATKADAQASLSGSIPLDPGVASGQVDVVLGKPGTSTAASMTVAMPSGSWKIYTVEVIRAPAPGDGGGGGGGGGNGGGSLSSVSTLESITTNVGEIRQIEPTRYQLAAGLAPATITATKTDRNCVITNEKGVVISAAGVPIGTLNIEFALQGQKKLVVTAQDGVHSTTYIIDQYLLLPGPSTR